MVETPRLQAKFLFAIGLTTLSCLPPLGGKVGMGVKKVSWSTPTLTLPHHRRGRGFSVELSRLLFETPRLQGEGNLVRSISQ